MLRFSEVADKIREIEIQKGQTYTLQLELENEDEMATLSIKIGTSSQLFGAVEGVFFELSEKDYKTKYKTHTGNTYTYTFKTDVDTIHVSYINATKNSPPGDAPAIPFPCVLDDLQQHKGIRISIDCASNVSSNGSDVYYLD